MHVIQEISVNRNLFDVVQTVGFLYFLLCCVAWKENVCTHANWVESLMDKLDANAVSIL